MRIPFDSLALAAVVSELQPFVGGRVQRVWQPDEWTVVLGLYSQGKEGMLLLNCHPVFARAHLVTKRPANPQPVPALGTALRARVEGGRLLDAKQIDFDRVLHLDFTSAEGDHRLVAELMGKHSNLMLLDPEARVIAAAKWVGRSKSVRPISPGRVYEPPPLEPRPSLLDAAPGEDLRGKNGASPLLVKLIEAMGEQGLPAVRRAVQESLFEPVLVPSSGAYPLSLRVLGLEEIPRASMSLALEQHFDAAVLAERTRTLKESTLAQLRRVLLAREVALADLRQAADTAARAGRLQLMGELVLAYGPTLDTGACSLEAQDYEGNPLTIPLDPEKTYLENAQALFDKAKRAKSREGLVHDQIARISEQHEQISAFVARIEAAERLDEIERLRDEAMKRRWLHEQRLPTTKKEERPFQGHKIRELQAPGGWTVLYGENAEANDYLTLRVAKPNDLWLHVRGGQSAHVVIPTSNHPEKVSREALLYAAKVAVQHSPSKHSGYVPVDYTLKKYVRRQKGAPKGAALYTHEKTLHVESD